MFNMCLIELLPMGKDTVKSLIFEVALFEFHDFVGTHLHIFNKLHTILSSFTIHEYKAMKKVT